MTSSNMMSIWVVAHPVAAEITFETLRRCPGVDLHTQSSLSMLVFAHGENVRVTLEFSTPTDFFCDALMFAACTDHPCSIQYFLDNASRILETTPDWQPAVAGLVTPGATPHDETIIDGLQSKKNLQNFVDFSRKLEACPKFYAHDIIELDDQSHSRSVSTGSNEKTPLLCNDLIDAIGTAILAVSNPIHIIWDRVKRDLTVLGSRVLQRAFWILNTTFDGELNDAAILAWHSRMHENTTPADVEAVKDALRQQQKEGLRGDEPLLGPKGGVTCVGYLAVCHNMLLQGTTAPIWALLWSTGITHTGMPYNEQDVIDAATPPSDRMNMIPCLSQVAATFFAQHCKITRQRLKPSLLWAFTPVCPWAGVEGMPTPEEAASNEELFVTCWRFVSTRDPQAIVRLAAWWGYRGDPKLLLVWKKLRPYRCEPADIPNCVQILVLGSPGCGKSSLLSRACRCTSLSGNQFLSTGRRTTLFTVYRGGAPFTLVFQELAEVEVDTVLNLPSLIDSIDLVLLCYDGNDPTSWHYIASVFPCLSIFRPQLPLLVVMTKSDLPVEEQIAETSPEKFCHLNGIFWPPLFTCSLPSASQSKANDADQLCELITDVMHAPKAVNVKVVTWKRIARRAAVIATGVVLLGYGIRTLFRKK